MELCGDSRQTNSNIIMAARPMVGNIGEFDPSTESWQNYQKRLEICMRATKVAGEDKVDVFLSLVGAEVFELLSSLLTPRELDKESYEVLTKTLNAHYKPRCNPISERVTLRNRKQKDGESISDYVVDLKKLSRYCEFRAEELAVNLRDTFVSGLRSPAIQSKLFEIDKLTWDRAQQVALNMEAAKKESSLLKGTSASEGACNRVQSSKGQNKQQRGFSGKPSGARNSVKCGRCLGSHGSSKCPFIRSKCYNCGKVGHIRVGCRQQVSNNKVDNNRGGVVRYNRRQAHAHCVEEDSSTGKRVQSGALYNVMQQESAGEVKVEMDVSGSIVQFTLDTAATVSVISEEEYQEKLSHIRLRTTDVKLRGYSGSIIPVRGEIMVKVHYEGQVESLRLIVVSGSRVPLLGREWLRHIRLKWDDIFCVRGGTGSQGLGLAKIRERHQAVFEAFAGNIIGFEAEIRIREDAVPIFHRPRPVPYALREVVEAELDRLEASQVITKVEHSKWASPIVVVPKKDSGKVRLCGDYKVSVNKVVEDEPYPFPTTEDLFSNIAGGTVSNAYQQLPLSEKSKELLTVNTHRGLYQYQTLTFGVSTAPAIFQKVMDQILSGMSGVCCKLDDILIGGASEAEHHQRLEEVLQRLETHGIKLRSEKCQLGVSKLEYLGHVIDKDGLHPTQEKVEAILEAKVPENVSELRSYLGMVNYYSHFLPNLATTYAPLYELLRKDVPWKWSAGCQKAAEAVKQHLCSEKLLVHYDGKKAISIACDASPYGIGAVISHTMEDGTERPIAYASRTLTDAEKGYAQLEKEALAIVFGVRKFHKYLYGHKFTLITDHKPLTVIFGPKTGVPTLAALRLQRWSLILMAYQYDIKYRKSW